MSRSSLCMLAGCWLSFGVASQAQDLFRPVCTKTVEGEFEREGFGVCVGPAGDVDGDGIQDVYARDVRDADGEKSTIDVLSGFDGRLLHRISDLPVDPCIFAAPGACSPQTPFGDIDGDGRDDLLVLTGPLNWGVFSGDGGQRLDGGTLPQNPHVALQPFVFSDIDTDGDGDRGEIVLGTLAMPRPQGIPLSQAGAVVVQHARGNRDTLFGSEPGQRFGRYVANAGDFLGDGQDRVAVLSGQQFPSGVPILDPVQGEQLGELGLQQEPAVVVSLGDIDGDGKPEFACSYPSSTELGLLRVVSSGSQRDLWSREGNSPGDGYADAIAAVPDLNGDGHREVAVGHLRFGDLQGRVAILSSVNGQELFAEVGERSFGLLGSSIAARKVFDGEGERAFVLAVGARASQGQPGYCRFYWFDPQGAGGIESFCNDCPIETRNIGGFRDLALTPQQRSCTTRFLASRPGVPVVVTVEGAASGNALEIYARWGAPGSLREHDAAANAPNDPAPRLVLPRSHAEDLYVTVYARTIPSRLVQMSLRVVHVPLALRSVSADRVLLPQPGVLLPVSVRGAGFRSTTRFSLSPQTVIGSSIEPVRTDVVSDDRAELWFELSEGRRGTYSLVAVDGRVRATLPVALIGTSSPPQPGGLAARLEGPDIYRRNWDASLTVLYENTSSRPIRAPLFQVEGPRGSELRLETDDDYGSHQILAYGIHPDGVAGEIPPGGSGRLAIGFRSDICASCDQTFVLRVLDPPSPTVIGWDRVRRPLTFTSRQWRETWPVLSVGLDLSTWDDYLRELSASATRLSRQGVAVTEPGVLFADLIARAEGSPSVSVTGRVVDAESGRPFAAEVIALRDNSGRLFCTRTDAEGGFRITGLTARSSYVFAHSIRVLEPESLTTGDEDQTGVRLNAVIPGVDRVPINCPSRPVASSPRRDLLPPDDVFVPVSSWTVETISSWDPNEKDGPQGSGDDGNLRPASRVEYQVYFENEPEVATAAAQVITLVDDLDADFDWTSMRFLSVQIGDKTFDVDTTQEGDLVCGGVPSGDLYSGRTSATSDSPYTLSLAGLDLSDEDAASPLCMDLFFELDLDTGRATWSLDGPTDDPLVGILPVNDETGAGTGSLVFEVYAKADLPEGRELENNLRISFDGQPDIVTNTWVNRISYFLPPDAPSDPQPADEGLADTTTDLSFRAVGATEYELSFGAAGAEMEPVAGGEITGDLVVCELDSELDPDTEYEWRVVASNDNGAVRGPVWSFRTEPSPGCPQTPHSPSPVDGGLLLDSAATLDWQASGATEFRLYLWTGGGSRPSVPLAQGFVDSELDLPLASLVVGTEYSWQVSARAASCERFGPVWSFHLVDELPDPVGFLRGEANGDGRIDISDPVSVLNWLFLGGADLDCLDAADVDDNGGVQLTDPVYLLNNLFQGGPPPAPPWPSCGVDPSADELSCVQPTCE